LVTNFSSQFRSELKKLWSESEKSEYGVDEMRIFQISSPGAKPAEMKLEGEGDEPITEIVIGERGRGRSQGIVPIFGDGHGFRAKKTPEGIVLVRGTWPDEDRCLAVINTVGSYDRSRSYRLFDAQGIETLMSGVIAFGDAGRVNGGEEILAIVNPGAEFRLNSKYASTWYRWTGTEWVVETPAERKARLALQKVDAGEGEWL